MGFIPIRRLLFVFSSAVASSRGIMSIKKSYSSFLLITEVMSTFYNSFSIPNQPTCKVRRLHSSVCSHARSVSSRIKISTAFATIVGASALIIYVLQMVHTPYTTLDRLIHLHNFLNTSHGEVMLTRCCLGIRHLIQHCFPKLVYLGRTYRVLSSQVNL